MGKWPLLSVCEHSYLESVDWRGVSFVMGLKNYRVESFSRSSSVVRQKTAHVESMFEGAFITILKEDCEESVVPVCKSSSAASL